MTRRLKYFAVTESVIWLLFLGRARLSEIPEGAEYVACRYDWLRRAILVMIEHPSFEPVPEGHEPPIIFPAVTMADELEAAKV